MDLSLSAVQYIHPAKRYCVSLYFVTWCSVLGKPQLDTRGHFKQLVPSSIHWISYCLSFYWQYVKLMFAMENSRSSFFFPPHPDFKPHSLMFAVVYPVPFSANSAGTDLCTIRKREGWMSQVCRNCILWGCVELFLGLNIKLMVVARNSKPESRHKHYLSAVITSPCYWMMVKHVSTCGMSKVFGNDARPSLKEGNEAASSTLGLAYKRAVAD